MKHGQKAKGKAAKAKASKKSSSAAKTKSKTSRRPQETSRSGGSSNKARGRDAIESVAFNNPSVAVAFKRAVKKYANAFRRLTD